jgi:two-component system, response regulator, stage 0 sporulation protein F
MKKVLVVEDEELLCKVYAATLKDNNYEVLLATDAYSALENIKTGKPDLIVLDIKLPEISGLRLLQQVRSLDKKVPIILCTAYDSFRTDYEVWSGEVADYIVKPVKLTELVEKIKKIIGV